MYPHERLRHNALRCAFLGCLFFLRLLPMPAVTAESVLFIADEGGNSLGNESVIERLETLGHEVTFVDDDEAQVIDPAGNDLIVISSTVLSSKVGFHFTDEPLPVIHWEEALWDEFLLSDAGGRGVDGDSIEVVNTSHPLASLMGLTTTGDLIVRDSETLFHVGNSINLSPDASVIAEEPGGGDPFIAVVEQDGELNDGSTAPAIRIALFFGDAALDDVTDAGLAIFDGAVNYALGITGVVRLQAGDADMDLDFDQFDLVQVQISAKYLTGADATWGEGDWDAAPGGQPGAPPAGNGKFDQIDIVSALGAGTYLTGPYASIGKGGLIGDGQTSLVYDPASGELSVDAPAGKELTSLNITSAGGNFTGNKPAALDGAFDNFAAENLFKATFGGSFGSISFGSVLPVGLTEDDVAADLSAVGSLAGGGALGDVDLIYVPEPSTVTLVMLGLLGWHLLLLRTRPCSKCRREQ